MWVRHLGFWIANVGHYIAGYEWGVDLYTRGLRDGMENPHEAVALLGETEND